jgi:methylglutaconyl-CoA hydratase
MQATTLEVEIRNHVATVWFNRPEIRNALDDVVLKEISATLKSLEKDRAVRAVVLAGRGPAFCAGADLNWMKRAAGYTKAQNAKDAGGLAATLWILHHLKKPTVARIHGPAYAGGMGFVAACDIAVASTEASFCLSETRLGLIPATIAPYVVRAMGERMASRYCLTAERFDAAEAYRIGMVHEIAPPADLDAMVAGILGYLVQAGPRALDESKKLIQLVGGTRLTPALRAETARRIAATRASAEGKEGIASFLEKRKPKWVTELSPGETS